MRARPCNVLAVAFAFSLAACGEGAKPASSGASAASPAKSSAPSKSSAAASSAPAPSAPPSAAAPSGEKQEVASGDDFMKLLQLPQGSSVQKVPGMEGFSFSGPKDTKLTKVGADTDRKKVWGTIAFGGQSMAALLANHEQDDGEKCMKLADVKTKLAGAKIVREASYSVPVAEKEGKNTDYGEDIEVVVFERDGKQGFWVHKEFNHGDDSTHICCTAGNPSDAKELKGSVDAAQVDALSSVCLSMTFQF